MKIALAQLNYTIGDIDGNTSKIIDSINKAKAQRADLVIFAEQAVSGTPAFDLLRKTTFLELCEDALVEIASCCDGIAAIVGLPILTREGTISAAALIQDRKVLRYVGKKYITARREMGFLVPSKGFEYATIKGHKCAIVVGDDLSREHDFDKSVETVISINARKYGRGTMTYRYEMMRHLAFVEGKNLVMGLIADQNPPRRPDSHWFRFLNQDTIFFDGGEKLALRCNLPVYFVRMERLQRGRYQMSFEPIYDGVEEVAEYEITERYVRRLEAMICEHPELWMWSHRRWKHKRTNANR